MQQNDKEINSGQEAFPPANTGNASNPSPGDASGAPHNQLLDEKAEKYIREAAPIEDYPDEQDWQEAEKDIAEEKDKGAPINPS